MTIFLSGKRRVGKEDLVKGGNNYCDGPALRWLGRQRRPRVWVSDGFVTVPTHKGSTAQPLANILECRDLLRRYRIVRVPYIDAAIEYLKTGRVRAEWYEEETARSVAPFRYRV